MLDSSKVELRVQTLSPLIQCHSDSKETINLSFNLIKNKFKHFHPLFVLSDEQINLKLQYNDKKPQFNIFQTTLNKHNIWFTDCITDEIFYKKESFYPRQFKSISAFSGIVKSNNAYVQAFVHFVKNKCIHIYAFVRLNGYFYQVRPIINDNQNCQENIHELIEVVSDNKNLKINLSHFTIFKNAMQNENLMRSTSTSFNEQLENVPIISKNNKYFSKN